MRFAGWTVGMTVAVALTGLMAGCGKADKAGAEQVAAAGGSGAAASTVGGAGAPTAPEADLLAFSTGVRIAQEPADADDAQMAWSPFNLIDESLQTDWTGAIAPTPVFVFELPERSELNRFAFDNSFLTNEDKSPKDVTVELSDTSATEGFQPVLKATLVKNTDGQSFKASQVIAGRWVRLTIHNNYGSENTGLNGFHAYGRPLTAAANLDRISGTYDGNSGLGKIMLKQEGSRVIGCYEYREGIIVGGVEGRLLKGEITEKEYGGGVFKALTLMTLTADGRKIYGFTRSLDQGLSSLGFSEYRAGTKVSDDIGDCPAIPGYRGAQAAKSQLASELETSGRARLDGINFDFNSDVIQPASKPLLDQVVAMLKEKAGWTLTIEGHTDGVGGQAFNQGLSERRAAAVKAYLVAGGIDAGRLTTQGFGMDKPVAPNDTQAGRAQNRRVELVRKTG